MFKRRVSLTVIGLFIGIALLTTAVGVRLFGAVAAQPAGALPADFADALVTSVGGPTALAFTPDNRLLITTQSGKLRVFQNGALLTTPALDLASTICANGERGLLGVAVDPAFATNRFIYLYYTFKKSGSCENNTANSPVNRVARFTLADNNVVDAASALVLVDNIPSPNSNHNAGDLHFGKDGYLYISVGDGGCDYAGNSGCAGSNDAARERHTLLGKILRITADGGIPNDNPYVGADSARCNVSGSTDAGKICQETFAWGLRNPFRMAFDPNASGTRFFINDVGQNKWEEINEGQAGADYGWNVREGHCANNSTTDCGAPPAGMTNPIHDYGRDTGCASITGGAFVPNGAWPASYTGAYVFSDYVCGTIFTLTPVTGGGYTRTPFITGLGSNSAVHLQFGPYESTQALYYTTYASGGQVRRISYTGGTNRAPTAAITASPTNGAAPLAVNFDGSASNDPDTGDTLTYRWDFGDGSTPSETTSPTTSHTYTASGTYTASLTVRDNRGASSTAATVRIDVGNTPPAPTIVAPTSNTQFRVGQTITLQGSATDAQDGTLADSALSWRVLLHHNDHTHPFLQPTTGNNITITAPAPEDLAATTTSYLEIELTATDSTGATSIVTQELRPRLVDVTFNTVPSGLQVTVNGTAVTAPQTLTSWEGYALNVDALAQTDGSGQAFTFAGWSDGGAVAHTIITPPSATTYTATFNATSSPTGGLRGVYYDNIDFTGTELIRTDATVNFDWGTGTPAPGIGADTFSVRWTGQVKPRYSETYTFSTLSDDGVRLWVNDQLLIDNWTDHAPATNSGTIALTADQNYAIKMEFYERGGGAVAKLSWSSLSQASGIVPQSQLTPDSGPSPSPSPSPSPGNGTGLTGEYFDNRDLTNLVTTRTDSTINFDWGAATPPNTSLTGADTFSVRWTGEVQAAVSGTYTFSTLSDDGVRLWVNNQLLIDNWTDHAPATNSGTIALTAGQKYTIKMEYYENGGGAVAKLLWAYPNQPQQLIPQSQLFPTAASPSPAPTLSVTSFTLINADTDQPIAGFDPLPDAATLNLATLPTRNLSVRVNTAPATVGSVRFAYDSTANYRTENYIPYTIAGDANNGTDYLPWTPSVGNHTLTATPYSGSNASGTAGTARTITFTVTDQSTGSSIIAINAGGGAVDTFGTDASFGSQECCGAAGKTSAVTEAISTNGVTNPAPQSVYQTRRYEVAPNYFVYFFNNLTPSTTYKVRLHFAENIYNSSGQRQFNVSIQGKLVLSNFDIFAVAGGKNRAVVQEFLATTNNIGYLTLRFDPGSASNPQINGIELIPML